MCIFVFIYSSSLTTQLTELTSRLDNMETSIKKDIRSILEMLQHPSGMSGGKSIETFDKHGEPHLPQLAEECGQDKQNLLMTSSIQPSESDFSFELCLDTKRLIQPQHSQRGPTAGISQVHRSISQPECTNTAAEKNLLR